jgi:hypothetical protein
MHVSRNAGPLATPWQQSSLQLRPMGPQNLANRTIRTGWTHLRAVNRVEGLVARFPRGGSSSPLGRTRNRPRADRSLQLPKRPHQQSRGTSHVARRNDRTPKSRPAAPVAQRPVAIGSSMLAPRQSGSHYASSADPCAELSAHSRRVSSGSSCAPLLHAAAFEATLPRVPWA